MLLDTIQAELIRLELHPVNLSASSKDDRVVALRGSLLQYWNLPHSLEGKWLLAQLQGFPDGAGPKAVMSELIAAYGRRSKTAQTSHRKAQLRLFDPQNKLPVK